MKPMFTITIQWKIVPGFNKRYLVSSLGEIRSCGFIKRDKNGRTWVKLGRIMKGSTTKAGYIYVKLTSNSGKKKIIYLHRLVAKLFIANPKRRKYINHKDGNPSNNKIKNLEWCTQAENMMHSHSVLKKGIRNKPILKLKHGKVIAEYYSINQLRRLKGHAYSSAVHNCLKGKTKSNFSNGHEWKYK